MRKLFFALMLMMAFEKVQAADFNEDIGHFFGSYVITDLCGNAFEHDKNIHDPELGAWIGTGCGVFVSVMSETANSRSGLEGWQWDRFGADLAGTFVWTYFEQKFLTIKF